MNGNVLLSLIKIKLSAIFRGTWRSKTGGKKSGIGRTMLFALLFLYLAGMMLFYFGFFFDAICEPFCELGLAWFYFGMSLILALMICFIGSVFTTQVHVYRATDNELLLSMPIKPGYILASRLLSILAINYGYALIIMIPAGVVYCMHYTPTAAGVILYILCSLVLPLFSQALSCFVAWVLELISSRIKRKNLVTLVLSLVFLGLYFVFISQINRYLTKLVSNGEAVAAAVKKAFFPAYYYGKAITEHDFVAALIFIVGAVAPFALAYYILSRNFLTVVSTKRGADKRVYVEKKLSASSPMMSLVKKELRGFTSSAGYMLNAALGCVFAVALAVMLAVKNDIVETVFILTNIPSGLVAILFALGISMCMSMNFISAPSISVEAKTIWLLQTLPVPTKDILMSKVLTHCIVTMPFALLSSIIGAVVLRPSPVFLLILFGLPLLITLFCALLGIVLNLQFPKFNWVNEIQAVKQGASPVLAMLASMAVVMGPPILYAVFFMDKMSPVTFALLFMLALLVVCGAFYAYICTAGSRKFSEL